MTILLHLARWTLALTAGLSWAVMGAWGVASLGIALGLRESEAAGWAAVGAGIGVGFMGFALSWMLTDFEDE